MADNGVFATLYKEDVNDCIEKKETVDGKELSFLSWAHAWGRVKSIYSDANYEVLSFGEHQLPYIYDPNTGYMVFVEVTINGLTHRMQMPVIDANNRAMKAQGYEVHFESGAKLYVRAATMYDINTAIMRCLTKCLAMHGLGLYIYAGEDKPVGSNEEETTETVENAETAETAETAENADKHTDEQIEEQKAEQEQKPEQVVKQGAKPDNNKQPETAATDTIGQAHIETIKTELRRTGIKAAKLCERYNRKSLEEFNYTDFMKAMNALSKTPSKTDNEEAEKENS